MKKARKVYHAKPTAQFNQKKVHVYGAELDKIAREYDGELSPKIVVEEARQKNSPLHECFEWNDAKASESWRRQQARCLINHIEVEIIYKDEPKRMRAFTSIVFDLENDEKERRYIDTEVVMQSKSLREKAVNQAFKDFMILRTKHKELSELVQIFNAIDNAQKELFHEDVPVHASA